MAKKSTLGKVREAVTDAAAAVAHAAEAHVVKPVGKALGLAGEKKPAAKKSTAKKAAKPAAAKAAAQKPVAKAAAKPKSKSPAARVMTKAVPPPAPKGGKVVATKGPGRGR